MKLSAEARRIRRLASHARYNRSSKGKARYQRYEAAHPNRATWSPLLAIRRDRV